MSWIDGLKTRARELKTEVTALYFAARHPRTPWYAKALILAIVAYALSPIDLIPDFIPVLGLLDDALLIPLGLWLFVKLLPDGLIDEHRAAAAAAAERPVSRAGIALVALVWAAAAALTAWLLFG